MSHEKRIAAKAVTTGFSGKLLNSTAKAVLFQLADFANPETGLAYPRVETLATVLCMRPETVVGGLRTLQREQLIRVHRDEWHKRTKRTFWEVLPRGAPRTGVHWHRSTGRNYHRADGTPETCPKCQDETARVSETHASLSEEGTHEDDARVNVAHAGVSETHACVSETPHPRELDACAHAFPPPITEDQHDHELGSEQKREPAPRALRAATPRMISPSEMQRWKERWADAVSARMRELSDGLDTDTKRRRAVRDVGTRERWIEEQLAEQAGRGVPEPEAPTPLPVQQQLALIPREGTDAKARG